MAERIKFSYHACSMAHTNLVYDLRIAKEAGFNAIEITTTKTLRYLNAGYQAEQLIPLAQGIKIASISSLDGFETENRELHQALIQQCDQLSAAAQIIGCPSIQLIALEGLRHLPWPAMRTAIARSLHEFAGIAANYGICVTLEPVVVSPLRTVAQALEVIEAAGSENLGLGIDLFHLWAGGSTWDEISCLDRAMMASVHIGDATHPKGLEWTDGDRSVLPGAGIVPLREGIDAVKSTGYEGPWTVECYSPYHWEWDPEIYLRELKRRMEILFGSE